MTEREEEPDGHGPPALLHELAGDVVDGGDMVGVDGVAEAEAPGEQPGAEQQRLGVEDDERKGPSRDIEGGEGNVDRDDARPEAVSWTGRVDGC